MNELKFIVEKLNDAPFQQRLALVLLDEKLPIQLLQVRQSPIFTYLILFSA